MTETIESLRKQSWPNWEAVVVDDGSTDDTPKIAAELGRTDQRIRLLSQVRTGMSGARNAGIQSARYPWILFLDADDWIAPEYFERMQRRLAEDPALDAVCCDFAFVGPGGASRRICRLPADMTRLFPRLARYCVFAVHACVLRKSLLDSTGLFDPGLRTCADWDFWQRISRVGARFGAVRDVLAFYRVHWGSSATDGMRLLADGLRVIERGHAPDARVKNPLPDFREGSPAVNCAAVQLSFVGYCAGLLLGAERDPRTVLPAIPDTSTAQVDLPELAHAIFFGFLHTVLSRSGDSLELWNRTDPLRKTFLTELGHCVHFDLLAERVESHLEDLALPWLKDKPAGRVGKVQVTQLELESPLLDFVAGPGINRYRFCLQYGGASVGQLELPAIDGIVTAYVLQDAIAADFAWDLLGIFFARTIYPALSRELKPEGLWIWRGKVLLGAALDPKLDEKALHDRAGWSVFLQELWGEPTLHENSFYETNEPIVNKSSLTTAPGGPGLFPFEIADALPAIKSSQMSLDVLLSVGGTPTGIVTVPVEGGQITRSALRATVTTVSGYELCRTAVREALIGRPITTGGALRERLGERKMSLNPPESGSVWMRERFFPTASLLAAPHRFPHLFGLSFSRRAALPTTPPIDSGWFREQAAVGEGDTEKKARRAFYMPELILANSMSVLPAPEVASVIEGWAPKTEIAFTPATPPEFSILAYGRLSESFQATESAPGNARHRLEEQLSFLRSAGFYSVSLQEWCLATTARRKLPGRPCHFSFESGRREFVDTLWPLLRKYGFSASLFVASNGVHGQPHSGGDAKGDSLPLTWEDLRALQKDGAEIGSLLATGKPLTALSHAQVVEEALRSRLQLERHLNRPVFCFSYPEGAWNASIRHLMGGCGYACGLTRDSRAARFQDNLLSLPRIAMTGSEEIDQIAAKLGLVKKTRGDPGPLANVFTAADSWA